MEHLNSRITSFAKSSKAQALMKHLNTHYVTPKLLREKKEELTQFANTTSISFSEERTKLAQERDNILKFLAPNIIVLAQVNKISKEGDKIKLINTTILRAMSYCYKGDDLYQCDSSPYLHKNGDLNTEEFNEKRGVLMHLKKYQILGKIRSYHIYDRHTAHLNLQLEGLREGDFLQALVVDIRLPKNEPAKPAHINIEPEIELSLKNSRIKQCMQVPIEDNSSYAATFYRLGISYLTNCIQTCHKTVLTLQEEEELQTRLITEKKDTNDYINNLGFDNNFKNISTLDTLIDELGISQYASAHYTNDYFIYRNDINFNFTKIRDFQNIEWSEQCVTAGLEYAKQDNSSKALEYYNNAVELDPLNKNAYVVRGTLMSNEGKYEDAVIEFKKALKLDPDNESARDQFETVSKKIRDRERKKSEHLVLSDQPHYEIKKTGSHFLMNKDYKFDFDKDVGESAYKRKKL